MSPVGRVEPIAKQGGFTLLEMICVMAIIALLASLALPAPPRRTTRLGLEALAMRAAAMMEADRYAAIHRRATITTTVDMRSRVVRSGAGGAVREIAIPADVNMRAVVTGDCQSGDGGADFSFYPDGRACGGNITFDGASAGFDVRVNWLTGGVEVVANPPS